MCRCSRVCFSTPLIMSPRPSSSKKSWPRSFVAWANPNLTSLCTFLSFWPDPTSLAKCSEKTRGKFPACHNVTCLIPVQDFCSFFLCCCCQFHPDDVLGPLANKLPDSIICLPPNARNEVYVFFHTHTPRKARQKRSDFNTTKSLRSRNYRYRQ